MEINRETSYIIGLAQTDGHLSKENRNRGRFSIELSDKDEDIIHSISKYIPYDYSIFKRTRKTNFSKKFSTVGIRVYNKEFRKWLNESGVPCGKKSDIVAPPLHLSGICVDDYVRGMWDGDGSVGYTSKKIPYMSFVTHSPHLRDFLEKYISDVVGNNRHHFCSPKRDSVYNIMVSKEDAVALSKKIYTSGLSICRKMKSAKEVQKWKRPEGMVRVTWERSKWTEEEDSFLIKNGIEQTMKTYGRTLKSVVIRLYRLKKN